MHDDIRARAHCMVQVYMKFVASQVQVQQLKGNGRVHCDAEVSRHPCESCDEAVVAELARKLFSAAFSSALPEVIGGCT